MNDDRGSQQSQSKRRGYEPRRFKSFVAELHREAQQRRPAEDRQQPHEAPLVRVTRWLVIATIALAVIGALGFGTGLLQWTTLRSTDRSIRGQLREMKTEGTIRRYEIEAKLRRNTVQGQDGDELYFTSTFTNVGKSDALKVSGWNYMRTFAGDEANGFDFLNNPDNEWRKMQDRIIPSAGVTLWSPFITRADVDESISKSDLIVYWGYVQYTTIFDETHSEHWCLRINIKKIGTIYEGYLPQVYKRECNTSN